MSGAEAQGHMLVFIGFYKPSAQEANLSQCLDLYRLYLRSRQYNKIMNKQLMESTGPHQTDTLPGSSHQNKLEKEP